MKGGLQISDFTWPGGAPQIGPRLAEIATTAEAAGFSSIWLMDHLFQIPPVGAAEREMLEVYTALGYIAALTKKVELGQLVTAVVYRHPGELIKEVTTLDVLSGGRAWLGIGAAWFEREARGLGIPFPPLKERFERLEETLQIAHQMWRGDTSPFEGQHYQLAEPINSPQALSRPHPPILIGGSGEQKTLRMVAKYADACNIFAPNVEFVRGKLEVLKSHCEREGRNYDEITKTIISGFDVGENGEKSQETVERLAAYSELGVTVVLGSLQGVGTIKPLEIMGRDVIPPLAKL
jgi:F420-dependent oxidoreductase-like protein